MLERMCESIHESISASVLEGDQIVYIARASTNRVMSIGLSVGSRLPAYCTSMGRCLLAGLTDAALQAYLDRVELKPLTPKTITDKSFLIEVISQVRHCGFSLNDEELELGLRSVAVPVKSRQGRVIAAMNIGVHAARVSSVQLLEQFLPVLRENALLLGGVLA